MYRVKKPYCNSLRRIFVIEVRKILVFLFVSILLLYKYKILDTMKKNKSESYIFITLICGLIILALATFLDIFANILNKPYIYMLIKSCFTIGSIVYIIGVILWSNFTKRIISDLERFAQMDPLTGVLNRNGILSMFDSLVNNKNPFYLIVCDLDGTKLVNDTLGHIEGDKFIHNTSQILLSITGSKGHVSRFGGDEFVILLEQVESFEVEKIIFLIKNKISRLYSQNHFGISIGHASYPIDGQQFEELLKVADEKMYEDKKKKKNYHDYLEKLNEVSEGYSSSN